MFLSPDDCVSGKELKPDGSCVPCEVGTYRMQRVDSVCTQCSADRTTPGEGSKGADECSLGECVHHGWYIASCTYSFGWVRSSLVDTVDLVHVHCVGVFIAGWHCVFYTCSLGECVHCWGHVFYTCSLGECVHCLGHVFYTCSLGECVHCWLTLCILYVFSRRVRSSLVDTVYLVRVHWVSAFINGRHCLSCTCSLGGCVHHCLTQCIVYVGFF